MKEKCILIYFAFQGQQMVYDPTIPENFLEQSKKIKQSSRGPRGYDINICVLFAALAGVLVLGVRLDAVRSWANGE